MGAEDVFDRVRLGKVTERRRRAVRVDVVDLLRLDARPIESAVHHLRHADRVGVGLRHVVRVVRRSVREDLCVDPRAAPLGSLEVFEHDDARALADHEAGSCRVERP